MRFSLVLVALALLTPAPAAHAVHIPWDDPALPERVGCGGDRGEGFPLAALRGPAYAERGSDAPAAALREWIADERRAPQGFETRGFRAVSRSARRVIYVAGHGRSATQVTVTGLEGGGWAHWNSGDCELEPAHPRAVAALWEPDPAYPPSASSRRLRVLVSEDACHGFASAEGRILRPRVFVDRRRVVVTLFVRPLRGNQTCPGTPPTPYVLRLPVAVGSRTLMDGKSVPARTVRPQP